MVPRAVNDFIFDLFIQVRTEHSGADIAQLYSTTYVELSESYFRDAPWPSAEEVSEHFDNDAIFRLLYLEMRSRHMFEMAARPSKGKNKVKVSLRDRLDAWHVYCSLFDLIASAEDTMTMLNTRWTFEILHEFVYQWQEFAQFRGNVDKRSAEQIAMLKENADAWNISTVMGYLTRLIRVSRVEEILRARRSGAEAPSAPSELHEQMGYFAMICQSRLECLLGDYHSALRCVSALDLESQSEAFRESLMAQTSLFYHTGFCHLMLRRYGDAARIFSSLLSHVNRLSKQGGMQREPHEDQIKKTAEKVLTLCAIALRCAPGQGLPADLARQLLDAPGEKSRSLQSATEEAVRDAFCKAAPKFVAAAAPDYEAAQGGGSHLEQVQKRQLSGFQREMKRQGRWPQLRSILRLYTSITVDKLAAFAEQEEADLRADLQEVTTRMCDATAAAALEPRFFVEGDMVHVSQREQEQRFEGYFLQQLKACNDIVDSVSA